MRTINKLTPQLLILPFFILLTLITSFSLDFSQTSEWPLLLLYLNGLFFACMVYLNLKKHSFSLELIFWLFMFFFMFYAPLIQYTKQSFPWKGYLTDQDIVVCNLLILLFCLFFCFGKKIYLVFSKDKKNKERFISAPHGLVYSPLTFSQPMKYMVALISLALAAVFILRNGMGGIVVSRAEATNPFYSGGNSAILLIVDSFIPAFLAYAAAVSAQNFMSEKKGLLLFFLQLICLLVCCFPTSIPRYKMACIYAPLFMIMFPILKKKCYFFWCFMLALFFILPIFSDIRRTLNFEDAFMTLRENFIDTYAEVDYDAYRMLSGTVQYVREHGPTMGKQLLGTMLFWVPRSVWPEKPGGSGSTVIRAILGDSAFSNVSCPLVAEGYINFGVFGVVLFAVVFGFLVKKFDTKYWWMASKRETPFSPYLYLVMLFFFMLRGDLLSSFAYVVAFLVTGWLMKVVSNIFELRKEK